MSWSKHLLVAFFAALALGATALAVATGIAAGESRAQHRGKIVKTRDSGFGTVLIDGKRRTIYVFDKEKTRKSECYGDCARAWPPVLTRGAPRARGDVRRNLLGTTLRKSGRKQVTYDGRPLYYYDAEAPGQILCQNVDEFGGLWLVVKPNGKPVR